MAKKIKQFSASTLSALKISDERCHYVYCLTDLEKGKVLYIGKGCGNRVFEHEAQAFNLEITDPQAAEALKLKAIRKAKKLGRFIISHHLTEAEAVVAETALMNFVQTVLKKKLNGKRAERSAFGSTVEEVERLYGFRPASVNEVFSDGLILAVKVNNAFELSRDERQHYTVDERDNGNLKSRTLGSWIVGKDMIKKVKYVVGIHPGAQNAVVSAYEVTGFDSITSEKNGKLQTRYVFHSDSASDDVLEKLGLSQKALLDLNFGSGSEKTYIRPQVRQQSDTLAAEADSAAIS